MTTKFVYSFAEGNKDLKDLLGGKGANLAEMMRIGIPVPPGFTITTEACREFLRNDITFRLLQGKAMNSFDDGIRKVLAVEERFSAHQDRYELAIVACLPASVERSQVRQSVDQRVKFARGGYVGEVGTKVTLTDVEVLSATRSKEWNIYWIRGITDQDQIVMFSNKESFDAGTHLTIQGKVKAHRDDNLTQLNYVKVL